MSKAWTKERWRDEARRQKSSAEYHEKTSEEYRIRMNKEEYRADRYRGKLQQLLKDAGKFENIRSEYIANLIGELL